MVSSSLLSAFADGGVALAVGDSNTEGQATSSILTRWTYLVQAAARSELGVTGGPGYVEAVNHCNSVLDEPTRSGTANVDYLLTASHGFGYRGIILAGSTLTFPAETCDGIVVWRSAMNQAGSLAVTVDGTPTAVIPCGSNDASYQDQWTYIPLASGSHTPTVTRNATGTGSFPNPVMCGVQYLAGDDLPPTSVLAVDGSNASLAFCPDSAALDITGDIDLSCRFNPTDPTGAATQYLVVKADQVGAQFSYLLGISTNGKLLGGWSTNGSTVQTREASEMDALEGGEWVRARWTLDVDNGAAGKDHKFYLEPDDGTPLADVAWGDPVDEYTVAGTTSIHAGTTALRVGQAVTGLTFAGHFTGEIAEAAVAAGIGGTVVADPDFTRCSSRLTYDSQGNLWTTRNEADITVTPPVGGFSLINSARSGTTAADFAAGSTGGSAAIADLAGQVRQSGALLTIVDFGANEMIGGTTPSVYADNLTTVIESQREGNPDLSVLVIVHPEIGGGPYDYPWRTYVDRALEVVDALGCSLLDLSDEWPAGGTAEGDASGWYANDDIHLSTAGHAAFADRVVAKLLDEPGFRFCPPTFNTGEKFAPGMDETSRRLFGHFRAHDRGYTVRKVGDTYIQSTETYSADLAAADAVYQGGHIHVVGDDEATALADAGYSDNLEAVVS